MVTCDTPRVGNSRASDPSNHRYCPSSEKRCKAPPCIVTPTLRSYADGMARIVALKHVVE